MNASHTLLSGQETLHNRCSFRVGKVDVGFMLHRDSVHLDLSFQVFGQNSLLTLVPEDILVLAFTEGHTFFYRALKSVSFVTSRFLLV